MERYSLRLILLTIELGHKRPKKLQWAYPDIALFLLGKALSTCLIFWVAARGKTTLSRYIRVCKETPGIRDLAKTHCGICQGGTDVGFGEDNDFRDSNERSSGCGIPVKKERECWISASISRVCWLCVEKVIGQRTGTCY